MLQKQIKHFVFLTRSLVDGLNEGMNLGLCWSDPLLSN